MQCRTTMLAALAFLGAGPAAAQAVAGQAVAGMNCDQLWFNRMQIYAEAGLCFDNPQGKRFFERPNCRHRRMQDVRLSPRNRTVVEEIVRVEQQKSCQSPS